ncbi:unnamed protein product [Kuraishia capsulata CBS 1993]|uniref:DNA damage-binding protein 1 n=1 Tax=Kuraishia capsulata CBS 1993 TaxID=1382522 RepID=W6MHK9_9ASCO|nr:uncharacterized protein KUCA_T00001180001 [Kuraishia capsulata CBS 1993]CDK25213.1 unnamed protein product [Kuraishia capsulata CBS 1993]
MTSLHPQLSVYNLTLKHPTSSVRAIAGSFSGNKRQQELVIARSSSLELWKVDADSGKLSKLFDQECFSIIRAISSFKTPGSAQDCLILTSDAGNVSVIQLNPKSMRFQQIQNEPYFKSGIRRLSPGAYVAVDGRGRAAMLAAVERNKLVYTLRRDEKDKLIISSPLEANKNKTLTFEVTALDVGFENPLFAAIECDYGLYEGKSIRDENGDLNYSRLLTFYELDLGLNHVVHKSSLEISQSANFLLAVPGGSDGPSGVLLCSEGMVQYQGLQKRGHFIPIPRRKGDQTPRFIVTGVCHKMKNSFFALLQDNKGDLFKVTLQYDSESGDVESLQIAYFDTMPVCTSLVIFKSGFMYADCEVGDKYLYQFEKLGDDEARVWRSTEYPDDIAVLEDEDVEFEVRPLDNLTLVDIVQSLNPLIDSKLVYESGPTDFPTVVSICGSSARSSVKFSKYEIPYTELVSTELPASAEKVMTTKIRFDDEYDRYIVLSFEDATLLLSIGETVEEVTNTGFVTDAPTIAVQQIGRSSIAQIHPDGIRHVTYLDDESDPKVVDWFPPAGIKVRVASTTSSQVIVGLSNRELVYFETDESDQLIEYNERKEASGQILSLSLGDIQEGKLRSPFIAVGCSDNTISIYSTDPESTLDMLVHESLSGSPTDALITWMADSLNGELAVSRSLYLHLGLDNGIYSRLALDPVSGALSGPRNIFTGPKAVKLSKVFAFNQTMVAVVSSRSYLSFLSPSGYKTVPIAGSTFNSIHGFRSEDCPENGFISVHGNQLTIFTVNNVVSTLSIESVSLKYTPKCMLDTYDDNGLVYVGQSESNTETEQPEEAVSNSEIEIPFNEEESDYFQQFGYKLSADRTASCVQVISVREKRVIQTIELLENQTITRCARVTFSSKGQTYLILATSSNQRLLPNVNDGGFLRCYSILKNGTLELVHITKTENSIYSVAEFQGKLIVGMKRMLVLYDIGQKQLLRRGVLDTGLNQIVSIVSQGFRLVVADSRDSVRYVVYKPAENIFVPFADDTIPRHTTCISMLDYDTVVGGDKFGNVWTLRCPSDISGASDEDGHGTNILAKDSFLEGAPYRLDNLTNFFLQDIPTSFNRGSVAIGGSETVVYTGIQGTIGVLIPLTSLSDVNYFFALEKYIAEEFEESLNLTGRSHLAYRGYYTPRKGVVDGDLLECFFKLADGQKVKIANKMDRLPKEVEKKISEMRSRYAF